MEFLKSYLDKFLRAARACPHHPSGICGHKPTTYCWLRPPPTTFQTLPGNCSPSPVQGRAAVESLCSATSGCLYHWLVIGLKLTFIKSWLMYFPHSDNYKSRYCLMQREPWPIPLSLHHLSARGNCKGSVLVTSVLPRRSISGGVNGGEK